MRVFVTGAAGYVGSAIARAFVDAGHEVTGLHHSPGSAGRVSALGARPVQGDVADPGSYRATAEGHEAMVHVAFDYGSPVETDLAAIDTLLGIGREEVGNRQMIYTSGCWVLGDTGERAAGEDAPVEDPAEIVAWRPAHEAQVLGSADETFVTSVVRPGMVYGGRGGLVSRFFESAETDGAAAYVGDGANRWSLVHREDLGRLYVKIAESRAGGVFHGVDGTPVRVAEAARAASEAAGAGGETRSIPLDEARKEMGPMAGALVLDQALETKRAGDVGWSPTHPSFLDSVEAAYAEWRSGAER